MVSAGNSWDTGRNWLEEVSGELKESNSRPINMTVREFLKKFGRARRGRAAVNHLRSHLDATQLITDPDFEYEHIDANISISLAPANIRVSSSTEHLADAVTSLSDKQQDFTLRMSSFKAARDGVERVTPDDPLAKATTLMQINGFSQLPVMTSDYASSTKGIISWESIANCLVLGKECNTVQDCMVQPQIVGIDTPLLGIVGTIAEHGYVLVRDEQNKISGIVTASDFSHQFMLLAEPFLLIGEIERHLRVLIQRGNFSPSELQSMSSPEDGTDVQSVDDLTFGTYCRILEKPEYWGRLDLQIDRKTFVKHMHSVREMRNDIMHFNPGDEGDVTKTLRAVAQFLQKLVLIGL